MIKVQFRPNKDRVLDSTTYSFDYMDDAANKVDQGFWLTSDWLTQILCFASEIYLTDTKEELPCNDTRVYLKRYCPNYKIEFITKEGNSYSYYVMDFCSLINDGIISISFTFDGGLSYGL